MSNSDFENTLEKGRKLHGIGHYDQAIEFYNSLISHYDNPIYSILIELEICWCMEAKGLFVETQNKLLNLLESIILIQDNSKSILVFKTLIKIYQALAFIDTRLENIDSSFLWAQKALVESHNIKDPYLIATSKYYSALAHFHNGNFERVFELLNDAIVVIKEQSNETRMYAKILNFFGLVYQMSSELDLSLKYYNETLLIYENLHDIGNIPTTLNNMSIVYRLKGEFNISLRLLKKAEILSEEQGRWLLVWHVLDNITEIQLQTGEIFEAKNSAQKLVSIARDHHLQNLIGRSLGLLAQIEQHNNYIVAKDLFEEALELLLSSEIELDLIDLISRYTKFLIKIEDFDLATKLLNKYESIVIRNSINLYKADFLLIRGLIERNNELNLGLAKKYYQQALEIADESQLYLLKVKSYIHLAENALEAYQINHNKTNVDIAEEYIEKAHKLANDKNQYPDITSVNLLRSLILQINGNIQEASIVIEETVELAKIKGLRLQEAQAIAIKRKIDEQLFTIKNQKKSVFAESLSEIEKESKANNYNAFDPGIALLSTIRIFYHNDFSHLMPTENQISVVVYFLAETGPTPKIEDFSTQLLKEENYSQNILDEILLLMGSSYSFAIGQGHHYQTGLFGPLPVPRLYGKNALVYSSITDDVESNMLADIRFEGKRFGFACLIYPKEFDTLFFDREKIQKEFESLLVNINTFNHQELIKWKKNLLNIVQAQFIPQK